MDKQSIAIILEQWDPYIRGIARRRIAQSIGTSTTGNIESDELAQQVRIKFWQVLAKDEIMNHKAYINRITYTTFIDCIRTKTKVARFLQNEEHTLKLHSTLTSSLEEEQDPAFVVEQEEIVNEVLEKIVMAISRLPPQQKHAMLCSLKN